MQHQTRQPEHIPRHGTKRVILLGSTGSIGAQTEAVVAHLAQLAALRSEAPPLEIVGLASGSNAGALVDQARRLGVRNIAMVRDEAGEAAAAARASGFTLRVGTDAAAQLVRDVDADLIVCAVVGVAGLAPTIAAIDKGVDVATANKETLVAAGEIVVKRARSAGAALLPVDSEHAGVWQCLPGRPAPPLTLDASVRRVILTASGGPFRNTPGDVVYNATPEQALNHPTWSMGAKVTIDCASLTNKGLELIEAHWLFGIGTDRLDVLVHPQSVVHAFVEFADGAFTAQLGAPDMRCPIQHALLWPAIDDGASAKLDVQSLGALSFEPPDYDRFPALRTALRVIDMGGASGAIFNAANERAVEAFLKGAIPFGRIPELAVGALDAIVGDRRQPPLRDINDALEADVQARRFVEQEMAQTGHHPRSLSRVRARQAARSES